jgi:hypothetical protein
MLTSCSTERERTEQQVLAWLERFPRPPIRKIGEPEPRGVPYQTWEQWREAGRAIPDVEAVLTEWYHHNKTRFGRHYILEALGLVGSQKSVPVLVEGLNDEDPICRIMATEGLGEIGGPVAEDALRKVLASMPWYREEEGARFVHRNENLLRVNAILSLAAIRVKTSREEAIGFLAEQLRQSDVPGSYRLHLEIYMDRLRTPEKYGRCD